MRTDERWAELAALRSPDVLAVLDEEFRARWVSPSVESAFGHRAADLLGRGVDDLVHLEDLGPVMNAISESRRRDGRHGSVEIRLRAGSGDFVHARVATTTFPRDGATWWVLSIRPTADDDAIVARRSRLQSVAHETALACSEMRSDEPDDLVAMLATLATLIGATRIAIWSVGGDPHGPCTSWCREPGCSPPAPAVPSDTLRRNGYALRSSADSAQPDLVEVVLPTGRRSDGVLVAELAGTGHWDDHNADLVGVIGGLIHAASQRAEEERRLLERSETDDLTGLLNSAAVKERIDRLIAVSADVPVAAVFGDLDGFKALNDRLGHRMGDTVLVAVAEGLRSVAEDTAVLGRIGGDEFVVAQQLGSASEAMRLLTTCRAAVQSALGPFEAVDMSMGVAMSRPADTAVDLLHRADVDMYTEKRQRARLATSGVHAPVRRRSDPVR